MQRYRYDIDGRVYDAVVGLTKPIAVAYDLDDAIKIVDALNQEESPCEESKLETAN